MKNFALALGFVIVAGALPLSAAAQYNRDRVCIYENNYFHGWEQCFSVGEQIPDLGSHRNKLSSIRVYGNAQAVVYANKDFQGASLDVNADINDMAQVPLSGSFVVRSWNDVVESIQVRSRYEGRSDRDRNDRDYRDRDDRDNRDSRDERPRRQAGVCVYEEPDYRGRYDCFDPRDEVSDLGRSWNDRISSVRVFGPTRITLYRDINFQGERITLDHDVRDLGDLRLRGARSWDNQASSFDINGGRGRAYGRDNRSSR